MRKEQETFMHLRMQIADLREGSNSLNDREERERDFYEIQNKEDCVEEDILPEFKEIFKENSDFCGWITIEGTNIDYPVMQKAEDREYYLHRDFYGKESYGGVPFVGNGELGLGQGDVFIYGHNMRNGTMFADLVKYHRSEYWQEHPPIWLFTLWEQQEYDILTAFYADEWIKGEGIFYPKIRKSETERREYVRELMNRGFYETEAVYTGGAPLLFLVTCSYHHRNGRIVVVGMLND